MQNYRGFNLASCDVFPICKPEKVENLLLYARSKKFQTTKNLIFSFGDIFQSLKSQITLLTFGFIEASACPYF